MGAKNCVFCEIVAGRQPAEMVYAWLDTIAFIPLDPVAAGHVLVVPKLHVENAIVDPVVAATTFERAATLAYRYAPCNLITSVGAAATQTVWHYHVHIVPRSHGDGLALPWTGQAKSTFDSPVRAAGVLRTGETPGGDA